MHEVRAGKHTQGRSLPVFLVRGPLSARQRRQDRPSQEEDLRHAMLTHAHREVQAQQHRDDGLQRSDASPCRPRGPILHQCVAQHEVGDRLAEQDRAEAHAHAREGVVGLRVPHRLAHQPDVPARRQRVPCQLVDVVSPPLEAPRICRHAARRRVDFAGVAAGPGLSSLRDGLQERYPQRLRRTRTFERVRVGAHSLDLPPRGDGWPHELRQDAHRAALRRHGGVQGEPCCHHQKHERPC
mmetsp:Transcript_22852/g.60887  ORF Transcript_22852/g.60887 Transcript_22852/m.60887 type:complete len:240 (-) Transcript_22852:316-1035(-)